ncbi:MAG TPA: RNA-binding protein hfq [Cyanobacteria bacterium UBA11162]|nr:RNA-binding protein hfq [Cyanobacteria bacterium UBA12227]HAX90226.1 RNA-binding protein hfq [Cyanobacteria bacterium UBA11370]HBL13302.1 RNA-binding protein hfq [Cyanobacteria bacterium UBA11162]HBY79561.1 RNA-binding protein hfq [Cyanobacteria bacterium UBA11148]
MTEFHTGLPSIRQLQGFIKEARQVEVKLMTNEVFTGTVRWQDQDCVCLLNENDQPIIIWRHALVYIKPQNGGGGSRALQVQEEHSVASFDNLFEG